MLLKISPTRTLHQIISRNVHTISLTETSGTYFVSICFFLIIVFLSFRLLKQTCFKNHSKLLDQNFFHCPRFLTALLKDLAII